MAVLSKLTGGKALTGFLRWLTDERANVGPFLAIMVVPIIGAFALAGETSTWYVNHRSQQNAADSAVVAAALKGSGYASEAQTIATKYGYTNNSNTVVNPTTVGCPSGASAILVPSTTCYQVAIDRYLPLYLSKVVGYSGTTYNGALTKKISASAIAGTVYGNVTYCLRAGQDITLNGGSGINHPDLTGCSMLAGHDLTCNGNQPDYGVVRGDAGNNNGTSSGQNACGGEAHSNESIPLDPIATQISNAANNLVTPNCPVTATLTTAMITQGAVNCYTAPLTGINLSGTSVDISGPNTVIVIKNGGINLGSTNLQTTKTGTVYGSGTIVFQGDPQSSVITSSGGSVNIGAPTSGDWSGIAIAETSSSATFSCNVNNAQKNCNQNLDFSGNAPNLFITGAIYAPNASVNIGGAINKATAPFPYCIAIDAKYITTSGNLTIYNDTTNNPPTKDCRQAGLIANYVPVVALLQ